ncbi:MAG TPA: aminotransferase class I/II-fold pyridoxal phosphate-dependent enzyme [Syntrophorhabdaceae bacterium]|nr:aminotransferase class I/II-fold pyridoxal phosphate-dependent enzyme [Syntrophorhabdaceae bacterium]
MKHFEDFTACRNQDIFQKANDFCIESENENLKPYVDALMVHTLSGARSRSLLEERDGNVHEVIMLGSNSYFTLTSHPDVVAAVKSACDQYGYGAGAVSLYAGMSDLHLKLERQIAEFHNTEDAILFSCGYATNVGVISALCGLGDVIINDAFNHASIFDGCRLSGADTQVYLHRNMRHLEKVLRRIPHSKKGRLIITDGVFSMDGDLAPLNEIVDLASKYSARVMVDDAHGLGVVGPTGRGTAEAYDVVDKIDLHVGMLSKTPGAIGGYCAGTKALVRYLRFYARTYFFSTSLPAPVVAGLIEVFRLLLEDKTDRKQLWTNVNRLREGLMRSGFNTGNSQSAIIPVIIGDETKVINFCNDLRVNGVYTNIVTYPAVRRKQCRLRLCVMSTLTERQIEQVLELFSTLGKKHGVI